MDFEDTSPRGLTAAVGQRMLSLRRTLRVFRPGGERFYPWDETYRRSSDRADASQEMLSLLDSLKRYDIIRPVRVSPHAMFFVYTGHQPVGHDKVGHIIGCWRYMCGLTDCTYTALTYQCSCKEVLQATCPQDITVRVS